MFLRKEGFKDSLLVSERHGFWTHVPTKFKDRIFVSVKNHITVKRYVLHLITGADPESLKGGCTKFSGPELPYSGFDPFF